LVNVARLVDDKSFSVFQFKLSNRSTEEVFLPTQNKKGTQERFEFRLDSSSINISELIEIERSSKSVLPSQVLEMNFFEAEILRLISISDVIWGEYSKLDDFVAENADNHSLGMAIQKIYLNKPKNEEIIVKLLNALLELPFEKIQPWGVLVAHAGLSNNSALVKQKAVEAFGRWKSKETIDLLESTTVETAWLKRRVDNIVAKIKSEG
jgi:hypothetical protein